MNEREEPKSEKIDPDLTEAEVAEIQAWLADGGAVLIDVREPQEYEYEHVPGALLHPLSFLDVDVFPPISGSRLVFMCAVGKRSAAAIKQLQKAGFTDLVNMAGGLDAWREAGFDLEGARFEAHDYMI